MNTRNARIWCSHIVAKTKDHLYKAQVLVLLEGKFSFHRKIIVLFIYYRLHLTIIGSLESCEQVVNK